MCIRDSRGVRRDLLDPPRATLGIGYPHTAHQFGLADIQGRDPLDDLLLVLRLLQHGFLPTVLSRNRKWLPAGAAGTVTNLARVLEGNNEGPKAQLPVPDWGTASHGPRKNDIGEQPRPHFQPGTGAPEGHQRLAGDEPEVLEQAELSTQGAFVDAEVLAEVRSPGTAQVVQLARSCLLYTSDAADDLTR